MYCKIWKQFDEKLINMVEYDLHLNSKSPQGPSIAGIDQQKCPSFARALTRSLWFCVQITLPQPQHSPCC